MGSRQRCLGVALAGTAAAVAVTTVLVQQLAPRVATVEDAVVDACVLALIGCVGWGWLAMTSVVVEAWRGGTRTGLPGVPPVLRRLLLAACGVVVVSALAQPASAAGDDSRRDLLDGLPMPERAVGAGHGPATSMPTVVVRAGDCLWALAAADLGPGANAAAVAARWRWIYQLNRRVIGPDPDLIRAGQRLVLPPTPSERIRDAVPPQRRPAARRQLG